MSSAKSTTVRAGLAGAIRHLRLTLSETQEGMARRLGCTLSGYIQWEKGRRVPGGEWMLKLMALCPDARSRRLFEEQIEPPRRPTAKRPSLPRAAVRSASTTPEQRRQARALAIEAIEILTELGETGYRPADQKLKRFADELNRVAGDFSRAVSRSD